MLTFSIGGRQGGSYGASSRTVGASTKRKLTPVAKFETSIKTTLLLELLPDLTSTSIQQKPHIAIMAEQLVLRGTLEGHSGWVTSLATSLEKCAFTTMPYYSARD